MLEELNIKNGVMDLKFDKYNYIYTVNVSSNEEVLDIEYKVADGYKVTILDNILNNEESYVYIKVYNEKEVNTYTLIVNKEVEYTTSLIEDYKKSLEVKDKEVETYQVALIVITCFIILLGVFILLFRKKKKQ